MTTLFITGASGFIGSSLLNQLNFTQYERIYCLTRDVAKLSDSILQISNIGIIEGGIFDAETYMPYLAASDTAIHLAAVTGKALPDEYFAINATGTQFLIDRCQKAGVKNFLYVSTIATKYPDKSNYYYAQSKEQGETAVKSSDLNYAIVRPTIVLGKEAPIWRSLLGLAKLPVIPVFGDGQAVIQPIYLDDLIDCLISILDGALFLGQTLELGGREKITFEQFLMKVHYKCFGKQSIFFLHLPLKPMQSLLSLLEKPFFSVLPITAGQLSAFGNDGTTQENNTFFEQASRMKTLDEMLDSIIPKP